jgi:low affinity Fe/Cu permease
LLLIDGVPRATDAKTGRRGKGRDLFQRFALRATRATGSTAAFVIAAAVVLTWAVTGPLFHFSDTWQLVINTGTTIVTFLMVFLIQHTQNKDSAAIQLKLDEIVAAIPDASNRLIDAEDMEDVELDALHRQHQELAKRAPPHGCVTHERPRKPEKTG